MKFNPMIAAGVLVLAAGLAAPQRAHAADCRNYCYDQYLQCIAAGTAATICARERSVCNNRCTSMPVRSNGVTHADARDRVRASACGQSRSAPTISILG